MTPTDITGMWVHENAVSMGGGVMRIASSWNFNVDGTAALTTNSTLEHDRRVVNLNSTHHAGSWSIVAEILVVGLPDHSDSPFQLSMTDDGELKSLKRGVWRRAAEG